MPIFDQLQLLTNTHTHTHTHTHPFNGPFSGTTRVSRYQKGKTNLDVTKARDSEWQWHQVGHMQVCTLLQTDNHTSIPPFFTGRMPFLPLKQQRQSTEGIQLLTNYYINTLTYLHTYVPTRLLLRLIFSYRWPLCTYRNYSYLLIFT